MDLPTDVTRSISKRGLESSMVVEPFVQAVETSSLIYG